MKVLQILNCTFPDQVGGAEASARELRDGLRERGIQVTVLSLSTDFTSPNIPDGELRITLPNIYDPWRDSRKKSILQKVVWKALDFFNLVAFVKVARVVKAGGYDLVLTHNLKGFSTAVWAAAKFSGTHRVLHVIHDYYLICTTCALGTPGVSKCETQCGKCSRYTFSNKVMARFVDDFVGVSEFVAKKHIEYLGVSRSKFHVVNNVRKSMAPVLKSSLESVPIFLQKGHCLRVGFIGRLEDAKGVDIFLQAMSLVCSEFRIVIAGKEVEAGYKDELVRRYSSLSIEWIGQVKPEDFYHRVDVVVVPSVWDEPYPAVAYEPQIFGKVVVASRVGGIPEIVLDGVTGLLYDHFDPLQLAAILDKLAKDPSLVLALSKQAVERASRFVDGESMLDRYVKIIAR